jgi:hypothetical protein
MVEAPGINGPEAMALAPGQEDYNNAANNAVLPLEQPVRQAASHRASMKDV